MDKKKIAVEKKVLITLRYKDYTITPCPHSRDHFDLYRDAINGKTKKHILKTIGYGYRFDEAILRLVAEECAEKLDIKTLKDYITEFGKITKDIKGILK